ncbi:unnamed protein product [Orchesella dallaii]|uniref:Ninjurin-1 n=1 Tax=Orchesella dallaii TaxID=48710 RepID=A0ABP1RED4_9HEXA
MEHKMNLSVENTSGSPRTRSPYVSKKTIAQGMLDVALLSSHTSQLVQLLSKYDTTTEATNRSGFHTTAIVLLIISITLQVMVGILLITIGILDGQVNRRRSLSKTLNSVTTILVFVITAISVVIPSFTIGHVSPHHYEKPIFK